MKNDRNRKRMPARYGADTRFNVRPVVAVPFRGTQETELERLKARLLRELLGKIQQPDLNAPLRRAANEAAGLAWMTAFPLLFFPTLLEEKAQAAQKQQDKQREVRLRTQGLALSLAE